MTRRLKSFLPLSTGHAAAFAAVFFAGATLLFAAARPDEPLPADAVGSIDGEAIAVSGPMSVEVVHGQVKTILRSGSDIRVKSGTARIDLIEGGQITICGPAHLSVLKSGSSLTLAVENGTIHAHIEKEPALTVYTPQIQAKPISIGDGPQDILAGFDAAGAMCIRANRGAVRLEQQLTGQNLIIPQAGDVLLTNGQLDTIRTSGGHCACELQAARSAPPPEVSRLATPEEIRKRSFDAKPNPPAASAEKPAVKEEPIYQVYMPPLTYDPKTKVQSEFDPKLILLVRRVRVRPTLIFQGRVEGEQVAAANPPPPMPTAPPAPATTKPSAPSSDGLVNRVRTFIRKLWSSS
ncbi:MAG TPA: hypothetical protein VNY09_09080 [Candidatus Sulfotelmatobacter sp.]|nr:hypothetical protein [Candidatus Sulfotelmatobacter sp.]